MASTINLKVKSDFSGASKDLKSFGNISEAESKRIKKFQDSFKGEQIDKFIDKNRRAGAAAKATSGNVKSLAVQQRGLTREMEKLIRNGLDPQDESIEQLRKEYDKLEKETEDNINAQRGLEKATKGATIALVAIGAAAVAAGGFLITNAFKTAEAGDEYAKAGRRIGLTAEALQELSFAADRQGVSGSELLKGLEKLNKNVGDLKAGYGSLNTVLKNTNPELLEQLKNAKSNEEAWELSVNALNAMDNQLEKASVSQALFGRSGLKLLTVTEAGVQGINELREEARKYGIISNENAAQSEVFIDALTNLKAAFGGITNEAGTRLLPSFTKILDKVRLFISDSDKFIDTLEIIGIALAGVTAGLVTFLIVTKGAAAIQALATAFRVLNIAIAANPIGAIAVVVITLLIPAIILLVKNWDFVVVIMQTTLAFLKQKFILFGNAISTTWTKAINGIKILFLELAGIVLEKVLGAVNKFLDIAAKLPFVGEKFANLQENVNSFAASLDQARLNAIAQSEATIEEANRQREAVKKQTEENIADIAREKAARLAALEEQKRANDETIAGLEDSGDKSAEIADAFTKDQALKAAAHREANAVIWEGNQTITNDLKKLWVEMVEFLKENWQGYVQSIISGFTGLLGAIDQLNQVQLQNQIANIDARLNAELEAKGLQEESEKQRLQRELQEAFAAGDLIKIKEKQDALERLSIVEKFEKEKANAEYKAALASWNIQLVSAIASGAAAVAKTLSSIPFPYNIPLGILQGAASAVQIGAVAAAKPKPPAFAEGGSFRTRGPQQITVGDNQGGVEDVQINPVSSPGFNESAGGGLNGMRLKLVVGENEFDAFLIESTQEAIDNQELRRAAGGEI